MLYSETTPEGAILLAMTGFVGAGYHINKDGTYNEKAKAVADDFNARYNAGLPVTVQGCVFIKPQKENETTNSNKKTSFWKRLFGH